MTKSKPYPREIQSGVAAKSSHMTDLRYLPHGLTNGNGENEAVNHNIRCASRQLQVKHRQLSKNLIMEEDREGVREEEGDKGGRKRGREDVETELIDGEKTQEKKLRRFEPSSRRLDNKLDTTERHSSPSIGQV